MAPLTGLLPLNVAQQFSTVPAAPALTKVPVDPEIRVCLDFIKGRCARKRCKFHHPEMAGYQQLSGAVQAQAGKQICEVWAMAGQCKFGTKCTKLHPVVFSQPVQSFLAVPVPVGVLPSPAPTGLISAPMTGLPVAATATLLPPTPPLHPLQPQPATPKRTAAAPAAPSPPQHIMPPFQADGPAEENFDDLAQSILDALDLGDWEPTVCPPLSKDVAPDTAASRGSSLATLFDVGSVFLASSAI